MAASPSGRTESMGDSRSRSRSRDRGRSGSRSRSRSHSRSSSRPAKPTATSSAPVESAGLDTSSEDPRKDLENTKEKAPFLIRVFARQGPGFHTVDDFDDGLWPLKEEYGVWAWPTTTLPHITSLLHPSLPTLLRSPLARYTYKLLYVDTSQAELRDVGRGGGRMGQGPGGRGYKGIYRTKEMGPGIFGRDLMQVQEKGFGNGLKTLEDLRFQPGDHLLLSITLPPTGFPGPSAGLGAGGSNMPNARGGMHIAGAAGVRSFGIAGGAGGHGAFSVFGASARGPGPVGLGAGGAGRGPGGKVGAHELFDGGVGAPERGSWKDAREANPGLRHPRAGNGYRNDRDREDRAPARGEGTGGWRGRQTPSGPYRERSPARERERDERPRYFDRSELSRAAAGGAEAKDRPRDRSGSPMRGVRTRSRSASPVGERVNARPRGARRPSPEYS